MLATTALSKPAVHSLPLPSPPQQRLSTHQISRFFLTLSQSGETKVEVGSTARRKIDEITEAYNQIDNECFTQALKRDLILFTLAFWKGRPLDSSFISTVDVRISVITKNERECSEAGK
jgi:hypothetical protein